ncbi:MAG TPA: SagB/ThcOx family dehydrogenase [Acetobacteraceae bacterium]|nr:SagB/ThcOx family dehydrogenase [Acetobacteraceae bacterium]
MLNRRLDDIHSLITEPAADSLAELYHENSKLRRINSREYGRFVSSLTKLPYLIEKMAHSYKVYPTAKTISLPLISLPLDEWSACASSLTLEEVIQRRRTVRTFSGEPLSLSIISKLLHYTYGITTTSTPPPGLRNRNVCFRAAPSAGALYPLEVYLVTWRTLGLNPGIYHYCVPTHSLELVAAGNFADEATEYTFCEDLIDTAAGFFFVTGIFQRTMLKYNERGYRFVLLDAGHMAENMCLMACSLGLGIVPIGGFQDDEINRVLAVDGINETVVYAMAVGVISPESASPSLDTNC